MFCQISICGMHPMDIDDVLLSREDEALVLKAVEKNGLTLQYDSEELRGDKDIVLTALANNGFALQ